MSESRKKDAPPPLPITFAHDAQAEPGDVLGPLAELLLDLAEADEGKPAADQGDAEDEDERPPLAKAA